ncbi:MAG TPA: hypothetical protein VN083_09575, partial [Vicinamibacteria bacterium]|nr:hypothetical protein [Vicinamibacteria bacterium]
MSPWQIAIQGLAKALTASVLCGLVARHRLARAWALGPYLAIVLASDIMIGLSPERFFNWEFFLAKEGAMVALKLALALEIGFRAFRALPGALTAARAFMAALALVTVVTLTTASVGPDSQDVARDLLPRAQYG